MRRDGIFVAVFLSLLTISISGCGNATKAPLAPPGTDAATAIHVVLAADASASRVSQFQSLANLSQAGATFLAATKLEIASTDKDLYRFTATFPTNTNADLTLRITPNQKYTPTADERAGTSGQPHDASLTHTITGDTYSMTLRYFLPDGALPVAFRNGPNAASIQPVAYRQNPAGHGAGLFAEGGGEQTGVIVQFVATIKAAGKQFAGAFEKGYRSQMGLEGAPIKTTLSSALEVFSALNRSAEYQRMVSQLDELEVTAEYPTNPLTQKAYAEDPGVKQQILDEIADARSELQWDTALQYMNSEVAVALGLAGSPQLSIAVAPITSWNNETAKKLMKERIDIIKKMIATGTVDTGGNPGQNTSTPESTRTPSSPTPSNPPASQKTPQPGQWTGTYQGAHKTVYPGGYNMDIKDKGEITLTVKNGEVTGTGRGHVVFHSEDPNPTAGGVGDGQSDYTFTITGTVIDGKVYFALEDLMPEPPLLNVVWVSRDGHAGTSQQPVTAPLMAQEPVDLKHGGTAKTTQNTSEGGMQITFTGITTID